MKIIAIIASLIICVGCHNKKARLVDMQKNAKGGLENCAWLLKYTRERFKAGKMAGDSFDLKFKEYWADSAKFQDLYDSCEWELKKM